MKLPPFKDFTDGITPERVEEYFSPHKFNFPIREKPITNEQNKLFNEIYKELAKEFANVASLAGYYSAIGLLEDYHAWICENLQCTPPSHD